MQISLVSSTLFVINQVWLKDGRWNDICQLAFRYLDVDGDGFLGVKDIAQLGPLGIVLRPKRDEEHIM